MQCSLLNNNHHTNCIVVYIHCHLHGRGSLKIESSGTSSTDASLSSTGVPPTSQSNLSYVKETKTASNKNSGKLQQDLNVLTERNTMCQEILVVSPGITKDDLLRESIGFLEACRDRMVDLIDAGAQGILSEEMFALVLKINDEVMKTLYAEKVWYTIVLSFDIHICAVDYCMCVISS